MLGDQLGTKKTERQPAPVCLRQVQVRVQIPEIVWSASGGGGGSAHWCAGWLLWLVVWWLAVSGSGGVAQGRGWGAVCPALLATRSSFRDLDERRMMGQG